jgi:hypothetical protein
MLGFAPHLRTWEGCKSKNWSSALLSAHLACKLQTLLAKCVSRAQAKCAPKRALKSHYARARPYKTHSINRVVLEAVQRKTLHFMNSASLNLRK